MARNSSPSRIEGCDPKFLEDHERRIAEIGSRVLLEGKIESDKCVNENISNILKLKKSKQQQRYFLTEKGRLTQKIERAKQSIRRINEIKDNKDKMICELEKEIEELKLKRDAING